MRNPFKTVKRETIAPVEGTDVDLQDQISAFWASLRGEGFSPRLIDRVWAANRCIQLTSQQIASMPLRFTGTYEPAWVSSPDPVWYPNGIQDAVFSLVRDYYGWGDAFIEITARYANAFPSAWTVIPPVEMNVTVEDGRRSYRANGRLLNTDDVVQISRNPGGGLRGTAALAAFAAQMWTSAAAAELGRTINNSGYPTAVLKSTRKVDAKQAAALQAQWVAATTTRRGAPAVLGPDLDFQELSFSPKDLLLLDGQEFDARVIAAAFGVPPFLLNIPLTGSLTYQNPEMLFETWWRTELRPAAIRIAAALSANMLPRGSFVEFDARDVLAPGWRDLFEGWWRILSLPTPVISPDEFRALVLKLPPQADSQASLDTLTVPSVASATPADQPPAVVAQLRPVQEVGQ